MGWAVTKAHGVLLQGRDTMTVVFYDPKGVILPLCIEKFDAKICLHYELTWNCYENHDIIYVGGL